MNTDNRLLAAARRMDKEALAEIFDIYAQPLYKYALRYCSDPILADQIVGDVFAKFLEQLVVGKGPLHNLRSYLFEITFNLLIDEGRYTSREAPIEIVDFYGNARFSIHQVIEEQLEFEKISQALKGLSPDQQNVIILRFLEGFSLSETATILGKTIGSVKITQFRAIWNLRIALSIETPRSSPRASEREMTLDINLSHAV